MSDSTYTVLYRGKEMATFVAPYSSSDPYLSELAVKTLREDCGISLSRIGYVQVGFNRKIRVGEAIL